MDTTVSRRVMLEWTPDGIMLSNGPGDPSAMEDSVNLIKTNCRDRNSNFWYLFGTSTTSHSKWVEYI